MKLVRLGPGTTAADVRGLVPPPRDVEDDVRAILDQVRSGGDAAVRELTERFDHAELAPEELAVPVAEIDNAVATLEPGVLAGLRAAIANVKAVAKAQIAEPTRVRM